MEKNFKVASVLRYSQVGSGPGCRLTVVNNRGPKGKRDPKGKSDPNATRHKKNLSFRSQSKSAL